MLGRPVSVALVHSPRRSEPGKIKGGHLVQAARELGAKPVPSTGSRPGETRSAVGGGPRGGARGGHLVRAARELGAKPVPSTGSRPGESPSATGQALSEAEGPIGKGDQQD